MHGLMLSPREWVSFHGSGFPMRASLSLCYPCNITRCAASTVLLVLILINVMLCIAAENEEKEEDSFQNRAVGLHCSEVYRGGHLGVLGKPLIEGKTLGGGEPGRSPGNNAALLVQELL